MGWLKEEQIDEIELKYDIKFNPHHRSFLKILHTLDRKIMYNDQVPKELFNNWLNPENDFSSYNDYTKRMIREEVLKNNYWLKEWGEKPNTKIEKKMKLETLLKNSPRLINLKSVAFVLDANDYESEQLISIWGLEVTYSKSFKQFLLKDLSLDLGIDKMEYDDEDDEWYCDTVLDEYKDECYFDYKNTEVEIPFWKDIINEFNKKYY